jgi:hypothetical protein
MDEEKHKKYMKIIDEIVTKQLEIYKLLKSKAKDFNLTSEEIASVYEEINDDLRAKYIPK